MTQLRAKTDHYFARQVIALNVEMDARACNADDPGDVALWAERWGELVAQAKEVLRTKPK